MKGSTWIRNTWGTISVQKQNVYVYFSLYMNNSATDKHRFIEFQTQALVIKTKPKHLFGNEMIITIFILDQFVSQSNQKRECN